MPTATAAIHMHFFPRQYEVVHRIFHSHYPIRALASHLAGIPSELWLEPLA
jgi:hypothetical protein